MSTVFRSYASDTDPVPKLRIQKSKTIKVAGMTLYNISGPIDETNAALLEENLRKLGLLPKSAEPPKKH